MTGTDPLDRFSSPAPIPAAGDAMSEARRKLALLLKRGAVPDFTYEARILVEDLAGPGEVLDEAAAQRLREAAAKRLSGMPLWRVLGAREFWGLRFVLSPGTLEPRPDSETLIEAALKHLEGRRHEPLRLLDLGTGTGCLLIAALREFPRASGIGVDLSEDALATAARNAASNGVAERAGFRHGEWTQGLQERFDLILSNPPYIASDEIGRLDRGVREHDPMLALDGGPDGLCAYRALAAAIPERLTAGGIAILEIGAGQADSVIALMQAAGLSHFASHHDLGRHIRALVFGKNA